MKDWRLAANRWYRNNRPKTAGKGPDAVATPSRPRNRPLWAIKKDLQEEYDKTRYNFMYEGDDKKDPEGYARFKEVEKRLEQIKREERS